MSDLHMATRDAATDDPFAEDERLVAWLDEVREAPSQVRLVLLGDTMDFVLSRRRGGRGEDADAAAIATLEAIVEAHVGVFAALARVAGVGHRIDVVPGNHDAELLRPPVQARLRALLDELGGAPGSGERIAFHPWILHVPGVLYAEHGQQHHDLNHFARLLDHGGGGLDLPPAPAAVLVDTLRADLARLPSGRAALRIAAAARDCARSCLPLIARRLPADRRHEQRLRQYAEEVGLPPGVVVAVDRAARPSVASIVRRLGRRALLARRAGVRPAPDAFMVAAARAIDARLTTAQAAVELYVFGHTHVAADQPLRGEPVGPRYLNAGTWSTMTRPAATAAGGGPAAVEIEHGGGRPTVARLRWVHAASAVGAPNGDRGQRR